MKPAEILIVGAGPAGIAAAVRASECGRQVVMLDDNATAGGQIWRSGKGDALAERWFQRLQSSSAKVICGARVVGGNARFLTVETASDAFEIHYQKLILATGSRELFLPFPGWTLPNIMGVGGLQALVKSGLPVNGKRIAVSGSGPLLVAVAAYLRKCGAQVPIVAEQAAHASIAAFASRLLRHPGKLWQAASLASVSYRPNSWVEAAEGTGKLERVRIRSGEKMLTVECDYLTTAFGFVPNNELALLLGLPTDELNGDGGVDLSIVEGEIAGYTAAGRPDKACELYPARAKAKQFAAALKKAFAPREELRALPTPETIVCRCEDVALRRLQTASSWRAAKLHERCGMGPCQGRICGPAVEFLFGWKHESVRPPILPARVGSLISRSEAAALQ